MFRALCAHHQEVKIVLYSIWYHHTCSWPYGTQVERNYPASGIITLAGGRPVHRLREVFSQPVYGTATYRCDDTRCCTI